MEREEPGKGEDVDPLELILTIPFVPFFPLLVPSPLSFITPMEIIDLHKNSVFQCYFRFNLLKN